MKLKKKRQRSTTPASSFKQPLQFPRLSRPAEPAIEPEQEERSQRLAWLKERAMCYRREHLDLNQIVAKLVSDYSERYGKEERVPNARILEIAHWVVAQKIEEEERYVVEGNRLCAVQWVQHEEERFRILEPLANFTANITAHVILDDGVKQVSAHVIAGTHENGKPFPEIRVSSSDFTAMNWLEKLVVQNAAVRSGRGTRDQLREAIQVLSGEPPVQRIFTHTGWALVDGRWVFLHGGGAIGGEASVDLESQELERYKLPAEPSLEVARGAMKVSLELLDIGPDVVTVPLWAAMYRAPLSSVLPTDLAIWLDAPTGNFKTTLAVLNLCHFGEFTVSNAPANWTSTANALEKRAFTLKDLPLLVDDYVPGEAQKLCELEFKASRLLRGQANHSGRGRLNQNLQEQPSYEPRGLIIATGEGRPPGESLSARYVVLEPQRETINLVKLTRAQADSAHLRYAMAAYLGWLAPQMDALEPKLKEIFSQRREDFTKEGGHLRIAPTIASLAVGAEMGIRYALACRAIDTRKATQLRDRMKAAFHAIGNAQFKRVSEESPARRYLSILAAALSSGAALMTSKCMNSLISSVDATRVAPHIGWYDAQYLYLQPDASLKVVVEFCYKSGNSFHARTSVLRKDLLRSGVLECGDNSEHTRVVRIGRESRRVLQLRRSTAEALAGESLPGSYTIVETPPK
jgi:hypothetical protein